MVNCWAVFKCVNLGQEWQAASVLLGWFHSVPPDLQLMFFDSISLKITGPEQAWIMNNWKREMRVRVCIAMTPFNGEHVLRIHVSYLHPKLRPLTFCRMIGWHLLLSLILYQSPVFIIPSPSNWDFLGWGEWEKSFALSHPIGATYILQGLGKTSRKSTQGCWPLD